MRVQLRDALRQGALGLSTGLAYASAFQSTTEEVMALAEELAAGKGVYTTHLRSEFEPILEALDEAFRIGRHGNVPVVVSHHKCAGETGVPRDAGLFRRDAPAAGYRLRLLSLLRQLVDAGYEAGDRRV